LTGLTIQGPAAPLPVGMRDRPLPGSRQSKSKVDGYLLTKIPTVWCGTCQCICTTLRLAGAHHTFHPRLHRLFRFNGIDGLTSSETTRAYPPKRLPRPRRPHRIHHHHIGQGPTSRMGFSVASKRKSVAQSGTRTSLTTSPATSNEMSS
jgi:hypothetical protein